MISRSWRPAGVDHDAAHRSRRPPSPRRTEKPAFALRRLTGPATLMPRKPDVGPPYFEAACRFDSLNLLACEASNLLRWWRRRESNLVAANHERPRATLYLQFCGISREAQGGWVNVVPSDPALGCGIEAT
jgi:hypothetical protein